MDVINEKTTYTLTLTFTDESGSAVTPSAGTYRIDDVSSGAEIKGETAFTPSASTHDLIITASENAILNTANSSEKRRVTVTVTYGMARQMTEEYFYSVKNLGKVT